MTKRWFITGGTPGNFGVAFADAALETGDRVVLTSRRPQELQSWAEQYGDRILVVPMDVTDSAQVSSAVRTAEEHFGGIDVLVNNAGRGWFGSIEGMDESSVRAMFELNFFGVLAVTRAVLPGMRARGDGWIVNVSSVLAIEPGAFRTNAYAGFADEAVSEPIPEYHDMLAQVRAAFVEMDGVQPGDPRRGAHAVIAAMAQDVPPKRLILGNGGYDAVLATLEGTVDDIRANEKLSRSADFPVQRSVH